MASLWVRQVASDLRMRLGGSRYTLHSTVKYCDAKQNASVLPLD